MKRWFAARKMPPSTALALLALRLVCGYAFMNHGWGKVHDPLHWAGAQSGIPGVFQALAAVAEFGGGLAWMLGLLTPLASLGILCTMTVAVRLVALVMHAPFVSPTGGMSFELPSAFWCVALLLMIGGPGRFSLDRVFFGEKR